MADQGELYFPKVTSVGPSETVSTVTPTSSLGFLTHSTAGSETSLDRLYRCTAPRIEHHNELSVGSIRTSTTFFGLQPTMAPHTSAFVAHVSALLRISDNDRRMDG